MPSSQNRALEGIVLDIGDVDVPEIGQFRQQLDHLAALVARR